MSSPLDLQLRICFSRDVVGFIHQPQDAVLSRALRWGFSFFFPLFPLLTMFLISCGGLVSSSPPPPVIVTVSPASAQPFTGDQVHFTANVQNAPSSAVTWQVNETTGGNPMTVGMIDSSGLYTAPGSVPTPPTVTVTAVLQSDSSKMGSASVMINSLSTIQGPLSVSPALSSVTRSQTLQLNVTSDGLSNNQVNWAVDGVPDGDLTAGTITNGIYTPPNSAGSHMITASLPNASGSAQVVVTDFAGMFTWRNDNSRSGQNQKELALAPSTVSSATFGKLSSCPLDGYAYAQPLYVSNLAIPGNGTHNVIFVATEKDTMFAFDADANANPCVPLWQTSLIPPGEQAVPTPELVGITSRDIVPFIGITGTPVIDPSSSTLLLYVVAKTESIPTITNFNPVYHQRLFALGLATGRPIPATGMEISTPATLTPGFSALRENQRAALLLDKGNVYIAFASHGGQSDYHGWLFGYDASTMRQTSIFDTTPGGAPGGGIWQSGGGPSVDSNHNVFVVTGNGIFDANLGGPVFNYGDSFLRLSSTGGLTVTDYFTPCDQATLASADKDLGSSAPVLLPDLTGPTSHPNLIMGAAKNGSMYLVDRDTLGGYGACPDTPPHPVQVVSVNDGSIPSTPLFWNNAVYVAGENDKLKAFPMSGGVLAQSPLPSQSPEALGPQGATPVVSWNGTNTNNGIIWLIDTSGALTTPPTPNTPAILRAFDAGNLSNEIYNSAMAPNNRDTAGAAVKFTVPTVANGKVYVGTQTELDVYGLLP
jgi:hypothetical protein